MAIKIGRPPKRKSEAWWVLSQEAKELLKQERMAGRFGGMPGKAPYWHSQEVGEPRAEIEPLRFIERSLEEWRAQRPAIIEEWLRG